MTTTFLALLTIAAQLPAPPAPPLPQSGTVSCELKEQGGEHVRLNGVLGWSGPRDQGKRFPEVTFSSPDEKAFAGAFSANWTHSGGHFQAVLGETIVEMRLLAPTYGNEPGAMVARISQFLGSTRYFAGFCSTALRATRAP